jgi:hypothetical protein
MLTSKDAAQLTVEAEKGIDKRAEMIWNTKIEENIGYAAARGETEWTYYIDVYADKYALSLKKIAESLGYNALIDNVKQTLQLSWKIDYQSLSE